LIEVRQSAQRDHDQVDQMVAGSRLAWMEEKCHLQSRIEELDVQLSASMKKLNAATEAYKQVLRRSTTVVVLLYCIIFHAILIYSIFRPNIIHGNQTSPVAFYHCCCSIVIYCHLPRVAAELYR